MNQNHPLNSNTIQPATNAHYKGCDCGINALIRLMAKSQQLIAAWLQPLDGIPSLLLRGYLVPILWMAGQQKLLHFSDTVSWFGVNGLGLPLPWLMAALATATELGGAIALALGLATRLITLPLMITMVVAAITVHLPNGWQAIADPNAPFANAQVMASAEKIDMARALLQQHGNYEWLTASGNFAIINNGIEFAASYFVMLLALLALGGGRYVSLDYWLQCWSNRLNQRSIS